MFLACKMGNKIIDSSVERQKNNFLIVFRQYDVKFFLIHFIHLLDVFFDGNRR